MPPNPDSGAPIIAAAYELCAALYEHVNRFPRRGLVQRGEDLGLRLGCGSRAPKSRRERVEGPGRLGGDARGDPRGDPVGGPPRIPGGGEVGELLRTVPPQACPPSPPEADSSSKPKKFKPKPTKFKLSLTGEQTTSLSQDSASGCHREESEHVSFATPRPLKVTVRERKEKGSKGLNWLWFAFGPGPGWSGVPPIWNEWGDPTLQVQADVERRIVAAGCPQPLNCTRSSAGLDWWLVVRGSDPGYVPNRIELYSDPTREQLDPFPDCPGREGLDLFPVMVESYSNYIYPAGDPLWR
jgi:hypothetical protein